MEKYFLIFLGVLLFTTSCQDESLLNQDVMFEENEMNLEPYVKAYNQYEADEFNLLPALKSAESHKKTLTKTIVFKRSSGTLSIVVNPGYCGDFSPPLQMVIEGTGIATHLGKITVVNLACVSMEGSIVSYVYGFITAACGSEIHTRMGTPYPDFDNLPNLYYPYTIIGGTGKYSGATGSILMYGSTDLTTGLWSFIGEGSISY